MEQWIQFETGLIPGPLFWIGKPAIRASTDALYAGYYVERGLPPGNIRGDSGVITPQWHWHGFWRCLTEEDFRTQLHELMLGLQEERRSIWIDAGERSAFLSYTGENSLEEAAGLCSSVPPDYWIDFFIGIRLEKEQCLALQGAIVPEIQNALVRVEEISSLVQCARDGLR